MKHVNFAPQGIATRDYASQASQAPRKPYQTLTRAQAALYVRECLHGGREPRIVEMVRRGIGADRKSARRVLRHVLGVI